MSITVAMTTIKFSMFNKKFYDIKNVRKVNTVEHGIYHFPKCEYFTKQKLDIGDLLLYNWCQNQVDSFTSCGEKYFKWQ